MKKHLQSLLILGVITVVAAMVVSEGIDSLSTIIALTMTFFIVYGMFRLVDKVIYSIFFGGKRSVDLSSNKKIIKDRG